MMAAIREVKISRSDIQFWNGLGRYLVKLIQYHSIFSNMMGCYVFENIQCCQLYLLLATLRKSVKKIHSEEGFEYVNSLLLLLSCLFFPTLWTLHPFEFLSFFAQKRWSISSKDRGWLLVAESYLECWTNTTFKCDVNKIRRTGSG